MPNPSILLVRSACRELSSQAQLQLDAARVDSADDPRIAACRLAENGNLPDLIVLAESRPGEISAAAIDELRRLAPLARVWRLLGSWCEGEQRSGNPPPGCTNTYWHAWQPRVTQDLAALRDGLLGSCSLPPTTTADESMLWNDQRPLEQGDGLVVIHAARADAAAALAEACRAGGYETLLVTGGQHYDAPCARAILWDCRAEQLADTESINQLRASAGGAPLVALVGFPRPDDAALAAASGVSGVVAKPFLLRDLFWELRRAIQGPTGPKRPAKIANVATPGS